MSLMHDAGVRVAWLRTIWPRLAMLLSLGLTVVPLLILLRVSLYQVSEGSGFYVPDSWTLANYQRLLSWSKLYLAGLTALIALGVGICATAGGLTLALFLNRLTPRWQLTGLALALAPKTAGLLAIMFGLQRLLPRGIVAAIIAETYFVLPYAVLILFTALQEQQPIWHDAARGLGATPLQTFRWITWPLLRPAAWISFQLTVIWGCGAFLGPLFLGGPSASTLAVALHREAFEYGRWPLAAAYGVELMVLTGLFVAVTRSLSRRKEPR